MSLKFLLSATYWGCMYFWSASPIVLKSWRPCFYLLLLSYEQQVRVSVCVALCPSLLDPHQGDSLNWSWVQFRKMYLYFSSTWQPCLPPWNRYLEIVSFCIIWVSDLQILVNTLHNKAAGFLGSCLIDPGKGLGEGDSLNYTWTFVTY